MRRDWAAKWPTVACPHEEAKTDPSHRDSRRTDGGLTTSVTDGHWKTEHRRVSRPRRHDILWPLLITCCKERVGYVATSRRLRKAYLVILQGGRSAFEVAGLVTVMLEGVDARAETQLQSSLRRLKALLRLPGSRLASDRRSKAARRCYGLAHIGSRAWISSPILLASCYYTQAPRVPSSWRTKAFDRGSVSELPAYRLGPYQGQSAGSSADNYTGVAEVRGALASNIAEADTLINGQ